jgi:hypothetical protein
MIEPHPLLGDAKAAEEALVQMRERTTPGSSWAAFQNVALDSANVGHLQFLKVGPGCTYAEPPEKYPADTTHGMGWRYFFVGFVDLTDGTIHSEPLPCSPT